MSRDYSEAPGKCAFARVAGRDDVLGVVGGLGDIATRVPSLKSAVSAARRKARRREERRTRGWRKVRGKLSGGWVGKKSGAGGEESRVLQGARNEGGLPEGEAVQGGGAPAPTSRASKTLPFVPSAVTCCSFLRGFSSFFAAREIRMCRRDAGPPPRDASMRNG
jgi:hypothetical protein